MTTYTDSYRDRIRRIWETRSVREASARCDAILEDLDTELALGTPDAQALRSEAIAEFNLHVPTHVLR